MAAVRTTLAERLLDLLYPSFCAACPARLESPPSPTLLCRACRGKFVAIDPRASCSICLRPLPLGANGSARCGACTPTSARERTLAVWRYQSPVSDAIRATKFGRLPFVAEALARLALDRLPLAELAEIDLVVPIPMPTTRRLLRGFDQAEIVARVVAAALRRPMACALRRPQLVERAQVRLRAAERRNRAAHRFQAQGGSDLSGKRILLVDDVVTTGSTLEEGARALRRAGALTVQALALAATPSRSWAPGAP